MPQTILTANANTFSQPYVVAANSRVTAVNGYVQYAVGDLDDYRNNNVTWITWPIGNIAGAANTMSVQLVRLVGLTDNATLTLDEPNGPPLTVNGRSVGAYWALDNGRLFSSTGYAMQGGVYQLSQGAVPMGIANTGTIATNGTVTLGTALNTTYTGGIWLYFPATAFSALAAGFYWTVMSSTTVGIVYTSQTSGVPVTGSNVSYTGDTTQRTAISVTIPANSIGLNGSIRLFTSASINNSAGNKSLFGFFGATQLYGTTGTTATSINTGGVISNRNNTALQRFSSTASSATGGVFTTIDTTSDQLLTIRLTLAVATDVLVLENWLVEILPA